MQRLIKDFHKRPGQVWGGGGGLNGVNLVGQFVQREWVAGGGGLYGYFREQGLLYFKRP